MEKRHRAASSYAMEERYCAATADALEVSLRQRTR
jgi:hypothetical protein